MGMSESNQPDVGSSRRSRAKADASLRREIVPQNIAERGEGRGEESKLFHQQITKARTTYFPS